MSPPNGGNARAESAQAQRLAASYDRVRELARRLLGSGGRSGGVDATDLVHESYLRLESLAGFQDLGDGPFMALASTTIRHVLVDMARRQGTQKRGGHLERVTLNDCVDLGRGEPLDLLALHDALERLAELNARQAQVVELRFFGGLDSAEIAAHLGVAERTVANDWTLARAWLARRLA